MSADGRRLLLTGASGLLGAAIVDGWTSRWDLSALVRHHSIDGVSNIPADLSRPSTLGPLVAGAAPDVIVHAAAWTDLDACEENPDLARTLHRDATRALAEAASARGATFVYISTDSLFAGAGPHREEDPIDPLSVYAKTKREGEEASLAACPAALVVRTCIIGWNAQPKASLAEWFLRELRAGRPAKAFTDIFFTPVLTTTLSAALERLVALDARGVLHVGGADCISKHEFALRLADVFELPRELVIASTSANVPFKAPRPLSPCLDSSRYASLTGQRPEAVLDALRELRRLEAEGWPALIRSRLAS